MELREVFETMGDPSRREILSMTKRLQSLSCKIDVSAIKLEDEDVHDVIGEVYAG